MSREGVENGTEDVIFIYKDLSFWGKKVIAGVGVIVMALYLVCGFFQGDVYAAEKRLVKVAFFPMDGYHITGEDGSFGGMDVEYLKAVCAYADWEVQYVVCESWGDALQLLSDRQVDLVGSAQYSAERAEIYQYADLASGYTFGVIATNADGTIAYEDFSAMRGIVFGMVKNYVRREEFLQYLSDNGILHPDIREYESTAELQQALDAGEIDALVHSFTEVREGQRLIGRFAPRPFYYISYPGNDDVMRELNQAIADVRMNQPELEAELMNRFYYSRFDKTALLTTEEKAYIAQTDALTVGYLDGHYPFSYEENGEFKGLSREMLEAGLGMTHTELNYVRMENEHAAHTALADGSIDILAFCTDTEETLDGDRFLSAREYADIPLVLVMEKNRNMGDIRELTTVSNLENKVGEAVDADGIHVRILENQTECLAEVRSGKADAALCDGYLAEHQLRTELQNENLQIKFVFSSDYPISVVVRDSDVLLYGILAKTILTVDSQTVSEYMLKENTYPLANVRTFIQRHSVEIILFLIAVVIAVMIVARHIVRDEKKIRKLMYKDTSMDIWNLNYLIYKGGHELLPDKKANYAVVYLNLSQFRRYNIIYGWSAGERLLELIRDILLEQVDAGTEICARNQGDRFVMLLAYENRDGLMDRLLEIKKQIEKKIYEQTENRMVMQLGIYFIPPRACDLQVAINYANQALEFTGDAAESSIKVYDEELEAAMKERHEREKLLEAADIRRDFVAYYQPKVDIRSGEIVGAEALVRFLNPAEDGAVKAPGFFVPYYEQTGRITEIDLFVCEAACRLLRRRIDEGKRVVPISCNFSRMHFIRPGFTERFEEILSRYELPKELIEVEITETLVVEEMQQRAVKTNMDHLKSAGIRLSIDDFGSGYSSLGVFEQIPAAVVKLDRSFLLNQKDRRRQVAIMRSIVNLTGELEAQIVCEGVETDEDVALMQEIGAYVAQGYYYSKPVTEQEFEAKLG